MKQLWRDMPMPIPMGMLSLVQLVVAVGVLWPLCSYSQSFTQQPQENLSASPSTDGVNSTADATMDANATGSPDINKPRGTTEGPVASTLQTLITTQVSDACTCNLTPDFCDIGCCCDVVDCGVADLSSVFENCRRETRAGSCVESWLMFRANVDPQLVTDNGSMFCVQSGNGPESTAQIAPAASEGPFSILSPHFSPAGVTSTQNSSVYKVDDVILTYYNTTSVVSVLRQPSSGMGSSTCVERNPAKFLRSGSLTCSRVVSAQSCRRDSSLSFPSYFTGFGLLRVPRPSDKDVSKMTIPIIPLANQPELTEHETSCMNVVTKVEYVITYSSTGEITAATVNGSVTNASFGTQILQEHAVQFQTISETDFSRYSCGSSEKRLYTIVVVSVATSGYLIQLATPSLSPPEVPMVGLEVGSPVIGWFGGKPGPLTIPGLSVGGECDSDLANRAPVLFAHNTFTGCTFRSTPDLCASLRARIYSVLRGTATPDTVAMTAGSRPQQSRVVVQKCPETSPDVACETGCLVPVSLSLRILWARTGTLALPQNHILGAKYVFSCKILKCPVFSHLPLSTEVIFSDATVYPEPPRAEPRPEWKFPFGFFTRGAEELDRG